MTPSKAAMQAAEEIQSKWNRIYAAGNQTQAIASIIDTAIKPLVDAAEALLNVSIEQENIGLQRELRTALANFKQED